MARPPKGKPLTLRPVRLDDDVWAECQRLGKEHGTINEGLAAALKALQTLEEQRRIYASTGDPWKVVSAAVRVRRGPQVFTEFGPKRHPPQSIPSEVLESAKDELVEDLTRGVMDKPFSPEMPDAPPVTREVSGVPKLNQAWKRGPRPKGDKSR
jgi:hypothetical protein